MDHDCACGHAEDEHDPQTLECDIEDCVCFYFDPGVED